MLFILERKPKTQYTGELKLCDNVYLCIFFTFNCSNPQSDCVTLKYILTPFTLNINISTVIFVSLLDNEFEMSWVNFASFVIKIIKEY